MNLIICGLPGSGKSSVGKLLSEIMNWTSLDTDKVLEVHYSHIFESPLSCREIYLKHGEEFFREFEKETIVLLPGLNKHVISVGGGALMDADNYNILKSLGSFIYLKISSSILFERLKKRPLPSYLDPEKPQQSFEKLLEQRLPIYEQAADYKIETDHLTVEKVVEAIHENLNF